MKIFYTVYSYFNQLILIFITNYKIQLKKNELVLDKIAAPKVIVSLIL